MHVYTCNSHSYQYPPPLSIYPWMVEYHWHSRGGAPAEGAHHEVGHTVLGSPLWIIIITHSCHVLVWILTAWSQTLSILQYSIQPLNVVWLHVQKKLYDAGCLTTMMDDECVITIQCIWLYMYSVHVHVALLWPRCALAEPYSIHMAFVHSSSPITYTCTVCEWLL